MRRQRNKEQAVIVVVMTSRGLCGRITASSAMAGISDIRRGRFYGRSKSSIKPGRESDPGIFHIQILHSYRFVHEKHCRTSSPVGEKIKIQKLYMPKQSREYLGCVSSIQKLNIHFSHRYVSRKWIVGEWRKSSALFILTHFPDSLSRLSWRRRVATVC